MSSFGLEKRGSWEPLGEGERKSHPACPVTIQSGGRRRVLFRKACNRSFRHTAQQFAMGAYRVIDKSISTAKDRPSEPVFLFPRFETQKREAEKNSTTEEPTQKS